MVDIISLHDGRILEIHEPEACAGHHCSVHNPSRHALDRARLSWHETLSMMQRICPHGLSHPDPDDITQYARIHGPKRAFAWGVHDCDGCCTDTTSVP